MVSNNTDNFALLKEKLPPLDKDTYYYVQIMRRKKEHPNMPKSVRIINEYFFYGDRSFDYYMNKIIGDCNINEARAYITVNRRSIRKTSLKMLSHLATLIESNQVEPHTLRGLYSSMSGKYHGEEEKKWVVDVDEEHLPYLEGIKNVLNNIQPHEGENKILFEVPTKSGLHLITKPFRIDKLPKDFPDVHKDNYTILYSW